MMTPDSEFKGGTLVAKNGWMITISDEAYGGEEVDDESSWGYWVGHFEGGISDNIGEYSTWVAGIQTDSSYIQGLIDNVSTNDMNFKGYVIGSAKDGTARIEMDSNNNFEATLDFGSGDDYFKVTDMTFRMSNSMTANSYTFDNALMSDTGYFSNSAAGNNIKGTYYGTDKIKSIGGIFTIDAAGSNPISGSFKANLVQQ